jgi:cobalt-precorrin-7 (C5)-methyltransferase
MKKIWILGLGPGNPMYTCPKVVQMISRCDLLLGGIRQLKAFQAKNRDTVVLKPPFNDTFHLIEENMRLGRQVGIIVSGDPGFYSLLHTLLTFFSRDQIDVFPGISSVQYLFAKSVLPWHDFTLKSLHGIAPNVLTEWAKQYNKLALLTDPQFPFSLLAGLLIKSGFGDRRVVLGERLSYSDECITEGLLKELVNYPSDPLSVVLIYET